MQYCTVSGRVVTNLSPNLESEPPPMQAGSNLFIGYIKEILASGREGQFTAIESTFVVNKPFVLFITIYIILYL